MVDGLWGDPIVSLFWTIYTIIKLKYCSGTYKTNFYTTNYFGRGAPPLLHMSILFFDKKFGCGADPRPPFSDNVRNFVVFFFWWLPLWNFCKFKFSLKIWKLWTCCGKDVNKLWSSYEQILNKVIKQLCLNVQVLNKSWASCEKFMKKLSTSHGTNHGQVVKVSASREDVMNKWWTNCDLIKS